ncbi:hypothetical protein C0995_006802 [Termitomyces sp. Mi166|nr:hypothetical protein C0995_006802 [Termitomyces sp. Mi166\
MYPIIESSAPVTTGLHPPITSSPVATAYPSQSAASASASAPDWMSGPTLDHNNINNEGVTTSGGGVASVTAVAVSTPTISLIESPFGTADETTSTTSLTESSSRTADEPTSTMPAMLFTTATLTTTSTFTSNTYKFSPPGSPHPLRVVLPLLTHLVLISSGSTNTNVGTLVGGTISAVILVIAITVFGWCFMRRRRRRPHDEALHRQSLPTTEESFSATSEFFPSWNSGSPSNPLLRDSRSAIMSTDAYTGTFPAFYMNQTIVPEVPNSIPVSAAPMTSVRKKSMSYPNVSISRPGSILISAVAVNPIEETIDPFADPELELDVRAIEESAQRPQSSGGSAGLP